MHPNDAVAVIAPASGFERSAFDAGLAVLAARYRPQYGAGIFSKHRYLAGDDERRLAELLAALADPQLKAVFCARGGYGATRLLTRLMTAAPPGLRKPLVGFSDITALHLWLQAHGRISIHGPVLTQLGRLPAATHARLFGLLESGRARSRRSRARRPTCRRWPRDASSGATSRCSRASSGPPTCRCSMMRCCCSRTRASGPTAWTACGRT